MSAYAFTLQISNNLHTCIFDILNSADGQPTKPWQNQELKERATEDTIAAAGGKVITETGHF